MDYTQKSPAILSLCPGMLGLERGIDRAFQRLGWQRGNAVAYVEIEAFIIENLVCQMEQGFLDPAPVFSNLKTFCPEPFRGKIEGITGGYPCQPFSTSGKLAGEKDPRHLWPYIRECVRTIGPIWCFFENVANHFNVGYETVRSELQGLGYHVEEGIYSAAEVGAPHKRERMFILAILVDPDSKRFRKKGASSIRINLSSEQLGNSKSRWPREISNQINPWQGYGSSRTSTIFTRATESIVGKDFLADSNNRRSGQNPEPSELRINRSEQSSGNGWSSESRESVESPKRDQWPSRPGENQHEWEHPRIESKMGSTINGYNFREDILRMAGNGVVEQTAEIAFLDLLQKHLISYCKNKVNGKQ